MEPHRIKAFMKWLAKDTRTVFETEDEYYCAWRKRSGYPFQIVGVSTSEDYSETGFRPFALYYDNLTPSLIVDMVELGLPRSKENIDFLEQHGIFDSKTLENQLREALRRRFEQEIETWDVSEEDDNTSEFGPSAFVNNILRWNGPDDKIKYETHFRRFDGFKYDLEVFMRYLLYDDTVERLFARSMTEDVRVAWEAIVRDARRTWRQFEALPYDSPYKVAYRLWQKAKQFPLDGLVTITVTVGDKSASVWIENRYILEACGDAEPISCLKLYPAASDTLLYKLGDELGWNGDDYLFRGLPLEYITDVKGVMMS